MKSISILLILVFSVSCQNNLEQALPNTKTLEAYQLAKITKSHTLAGVFLTTQPSPGDFTKLQEAGLKTVINLRHTGENVEFDEQSVVTELGMKYIHLPWSSTEELTPEIFETTRKLLNTEARPILIHCKSANRVGAVWIPWRVLDGDIAIEDAVNEAETIGLKNCDYETNAKEHIAYFSLRTDC